MDRVGLAGMCGFSRARERDLEGWFKTVREGFFWNGDFSQ